MTEQERINELVSMLDSFVENGGGHLNVLVEETDSDSEESNIKVETFKSNDCCNGNMACAVPTLHKDIDDN